VNGSPPIGAAAAQPVLLAQQTNAPGDKTPGTSSSQATQQGQNIHANHPLPPLQQLHGTQQQSQLPIGPGVDPSDDRYVVTA
jgi:hypothetical protein